MKRLSIVILTFNEKDETDRCLNSIVPCVDFGLDEVIVFDNASADGTDKLIREQYPEVKYLYSKVNLGIGPGRNMAIEASSGKYVMTLDNDTVFRGIEKPGDIVELFFKQHPNTGVLGFKLLNENSTVQRSIRRFPPSIQPFVARLPFLRLFPFLARIEDNHLKCDIDLENAKRAMPVDYMIGANQIFERDLFNIIGGYDKKMFYGAEDCEFCLRSKKIGHENYYYPAVSISHLHKRRSKQSISLILHHTFSFYYMFFKHKRIFRLYP